MYIHRYTLSVNDTQRKGNFDQMIAAGKYNRVDFDINPKNFPFNPKNVETKVAIVDFSDSLWISNDQVLEEFKKTNLGLIQDLSTILACGAQQTELQIEECCLISLSPFWTDSLGYKRVVRFLTGRLPFLELATVHWNTVWYGFNRFLVTYS
ncbi:MAG: hypothetical protein A3B74_02160 [Candidatus Kerfeldbacteria bacterium RIFCSPHIGHO2_02_FULL_42_14]|uniref:Uncharacterized protein n=1 Tax=Candidatus Kerfeldbacteria bacterium RIFCSPHIGHO2_02_FULL_42_14 TaxID=1798540 RepID=A0A1G2AR62_9BACT|nr:MAG: hypothetical protein A3B74_02160 [Candidatus Kerfeldbacteria bacterium RIFCSPHIGHO2_02_FULL_42_14]OGY81820.1 MAG: hypothetical protein A3E60_00735 [Candidatus Kerfeldbacteria bacterium RIFCSPHIGHO2_12_FULL_42_13]OGY84509.1 MAG: hypothetical protein A3I91_00350 [Candidatus Kerfeldbacteria bacterium RIFCSPLOWO2_02_FULL_42_19]OGY87616.1 MAG: hypothetical protein A3G01_02700 [Candidatus Kerfeldbacteria bacterium RIFCSPLOWO2_12_FULL_43_9]